MFLGHYQLGQEIAFRVYCRTAAGVPTAPEDAPEISVYSASAKLFSSRAIPSKDQGVLTGLFEARILLNEAYSEGEHTVHVHYHVGGTHVAESRAFTVLPGGGPTGTVNSMYAYDRPHASYLVQGRTTGRIYKGKNPRV